MGTGGGGVELVEQVVSEPWEGVLVEPGGGEPGGSEPGGGETGGAGTRAGVVVLSGSSGRLETGRCRVLAAQGLTCLAIRWFGGPGQTPGICEVPLETFTAAVDLLAARGVGRIGILGLSKGAEAALLTAIRDPRIDAVVALSPTAVVWANTGPGHDGQRLPARSSWTWHGEPLPFLPYDQSWTSPDADDQPVAYRGLYQASLRAFAGATPQAAIPVELARAEIVLVAGGDDQMWPSLDFARDLQARASAAGRPVTVVSAPDAGHGIRLPGESPAALSPHRNYGGTAQADAALGAQAWPHILAVLSGAGVG
jgi:uncharacterized protein